MTHENPNRDKTSQNDPKRAKITQNAKATQKETIFDTKQPRTTHNELKRLKKRHKFTQNDPKPAKKIQKES